MQTIIDFDLEHVVLALEDIDKKIMDVEDGYTLQSDVKTSNGYVNIQMNEDALLLQGVMLFDICHVVDDLAEGDKVQTTVKIHRDKCAILHCETTGDNDLANLVLREILQRYYAIQK
jgi:Cu/Ag efflux pump CusA